MVELKELSKDTDGMSTYDYLVNHVPNCLDEMDYLTENLMRVDTTGQFLASSARYLASINRELFDKWIGRLIEGAIDKDRERRYIWSLLKAIWGEDYLDRVDELNSTDDNFRRVFKRVYPDKKKMTVTI